VSDREIPVVSLCIVVGDWIDHGLWCNECALPSMSAFPIYALSKSGVSRSMALHCSGCKERAENAGQP
jgi:hypothetical protein